MSTGNGRSRGPFGPMQQVDEVQREIVDAALRVATELSALAGDLNAAKPSANGDRSHRATVDIGALRSTVARSLDLAVDAMQSLVDSGLDAIEQFTTDTRIRHRVQPGGIVTLRSTGQDADAPRAVVPPLHGSDGTTLTVHCEVGDHGVELWVPADAASGTFHGVVLDPEDPDRAVLLTIDVASDPA